MRKLSPAQDSAMMHLSRNQGWSKLSNCMLRTWVRLAELGLVDIEIRTPVDGSVRMTNRGRELYPESKETTE